MREPLDLERPREQVCPICHDHGWYRGAGTGVRIACESCGVGQGIIATGVAKQLLQQVYSTRDSDLFLESRSPMFGGLRPKELLREGGARAEDVLSAIELIPGVTPRDETEKMLAVATVEHPDEPEKIPQDPALLRRVLTAQMRRAGENRIARALELGTTEGLVDRDQAVLDSAMTGNGYLVGGKRVDPTTVEVFRWDTSSR